ncbi:MAG: ankyrin repeat domain-containing protein [Pseudomonadota bacterium]
MQSINPSVSIQTSKSFDSLPANETNVIPRSPSYDDMRVPSDVSPFQSTPNHLEIIRSQFIDKIKNDLLKDKSIPIGTALELHRAYLESTITLQQGGTIKWPEIPKEELVATVNNFFNDAVDKFTDIQNFPNESLLLFKEDGALRKFCLSHIDNLPAKDLLGSLEYFVNKLCQSSNVLRENALHIFPPFNGDYKYEVCVAGMHISLNEAILSLDDSHPIQIHQTQIIRNIIDKFIDKNNVLKDVHDGNHIHTPFYFLSLIYPDSLIEKIDEFHLLPRSNIKTTLLYQFINELPMELQNESNNMLNEYIENSMNEEFSRLAKYFNNATQSILSIPVDDIDYKKLDNLELLKYINIRSIDIIPNVINETMDSDYAWDPQNLKNFLFEKTLNHISKPFINFKPSVYLNLKQSTFKELRDITAPSLLDVKDSEIVETFINKIFILSIEAEFDSQFKLLRTLHNLGINSENISRFEKAKSILEKIKYNLPSDRNDLKNRLSRVQEHINFLQTNSSEESNNEYKNWIERDLIPLEKLLLLNSSSKEIKAALEKECFYNPNYKLPKESSIFFIIHNPEGIECFKLLEKYCSDDQKLALFIPAIANGITELVEVLFEHCINSINQSNISEVPITVAFDKNNIDIVKIFLQQNDEFVQNILRHTDEDGNTPLHKAAKLYSPAILQLLLTADSSPTKNTLQIKNQYGKRVLDIAVKDSKPENVKIILNLMSAHGLMLKTSHKNHLINRANRNNSEEFPTEILDLLKKHPSQNMMSRGLIQLGKKFSS